MSETPTNGTLRDGPGRPTPALRGAPDRPVLEGLEAAWVKRWADDGIYHFDGAVPKHRVYSIDTPPPTVSGALHVGTVFSYTHTDCVARYKRMRGYSVWYPMGWDDNGLPTERRVQNYYGVRCDPSLPHDPTFVPPAEGGLSRGQQPVAVSRVNFVELCNRLTAQDERAFEDLWRYLGLSVDWRYLYTTIGERSRRASQRAFLRLLARGEAYTAEAPTLWDVDFRTAVAQAELVDRERPGAYYTLAFHLPAGADLLIDTTRPELLPACVAVVVHPSDPRYSALVGTTVTTPLFGASVPVVAHTLAEPDKGTGAAMACTFGDLTDVTWWRELARPARVIVGRDGRLVGLAPPGLTPAGVSAYEADLAGKTVAAAHKRVAELLQASGELRGSPRSITHFVKFYEKGERPLEIVTSRQWWIMTLNHKERLIQLGRQLRWHPAFMRARYEDWVQGLVSDWLISRQRFNGVPFPIWYRLDERGEADHEHPIVAREDALPVDPSADVPPGYSPDQRDVPGGFTADMDVMDTWATSSLTPQIAGGWEEPSAGDLWSLVFPMDLRPQGHDIIRTWLFSTVVRSYLEHGCLPWSNAAISGFILDPDRKKMSKSVGNVVTPRSLLEEYGSDAVRYWAASGRPGMDTSFDEGQIKVGRRLALKLLNASRFVLGPKLWVGEGGSRGEAAALAATASGKLDLAVEAVDRALLASLAELVAVSTRAFEDYDYARALERTEAWFWGFCDNYLELVKTRAYGETEPGRAGSARATLALALSVLLRLFAPFLPFVTEEVWSWWHSGSVHRAPWPKSAEMGPAAQGEVAVYGEAVELLAAIRRAKSEAKVSPRAAVERVVFRGSPVRIAALEKAADDLRAAQNVSDLVLEEGEEVPIQVHLATVAPA